MGAGMIVVDANVIAYFFIEGEKTTLARQVREMDPRWVAPEMWRHEFLNIMVTNCLFAKLPLGMAERIWTDAEDLMRGSEYVAEMRRVLHLAVDKSVTAYDTEYVLLAQCLGIPCVTEDGPLQKAFPGTAVPMAAFLGVAGMPDAVREKRAAYVTRRAKG